MAKGNTRFFGFRPSEKVFDEYVQTIKERKESNEISQNASICGELENLMRAEISRHNAAKAGA